MAKTPPKKATPPKTAAPATPAASPLTLLSDLSNAVAVSGDEGAVRQIVLEAIKDLVDDVKVDALGNVLAVKKGTGRERVLVAAHMDEVGFMVSDIDADGLVRFETVGGVDENTLLGKPVLIGAKRVPGIVGHAPIHLLSVDQRSVPTKARQMRIDLGANSAEAAKKLVRLGDRGAFATEFAEVGPSVRGKALDDRLGCATLIELLHGEPYPFELHAAFTVQEEVGLRGAQVAGYATDPACAFVLDCTPASDLPAPNPNKENTLYNVKLGLGPALYVMDRATISDQRLVRYLQDTADKAAIPFQLRQPGAGGTDAGAIHTVRKGVPSVSMSVPGRYLHGPATIARTADWRHSVALMRAALENWSSKVLKR